MAIHYLVHASGDYRIDVHADKINLGLHRLWFFDAEDNVLAVFRWDQIHGFSIEGSASGQVVIEELAHERNVAKNKVEALQRSHGPVIAALELADQTLEEAQNKVRRVWLVMNEAKAKTSETQLLLKQHQADIVRLQARFEDRQRDLDSAMKQVLEDIKSVLSRIS
jgi:hypothetical protein